MGFDKVSSNCLSGASHGKYVLTRHFILRLPGFPIELISSMASYDLAIMIDGVRKIKELCSSQAQALLSTARGLSRHDALRLKRCMPLEYSVGTGLSREAVNEFNELLARGNDLQNRATDLHAKEMNRSRQMLYDFVVEESFQDVLLQSSPGLSRFTPATPVPPSVRNSHVRQRELSWVSYLQRLATKNETISFFGPSVWGEFDLQEPAAAAIELSQPRIDKRSVYVERWVCEAIGRRFADDPQTAPLLHLRLADDLMVQDGRAILLKSGTSFALSPEELEILEDCRTFLRRRLEASGVESLLERGLLVQKVQIPPDPLPFLALQREVDSWPEHPQRTLWQSRLAELDRHRNELELADGLNERRSAMAKVRAFLEMLNINDFNDSQRLYSSRLPVNEDCRLGVNKLVLGKPFVERLLNDAAPWFDLWRDIAGLYATRLHQSMKASWMEIGGKPVPVPLFLPSILKAWKGLSELESEIQKAWGEQLGDRHSESIVTLTEEDTGFLRRKFEFRRMKAFDNMAPDLQIVAADEEALRDGRWTLLIAEIHPDWTPWEKCFFLWCPDPEKFRNDYASEGGQGTAIILGNSLPYFGTAHTSFSIYPHAQRWSFVGGAAIDGMKSVRSAEAFVTVTDDDVVIEDADRKTLGSFLHTWQTAANTHRLDLQGGADHSPRLQVGRVVVQRESWKIRPDAALLGAAKTGGEAAFAAWRKLRADHGLPESVYLRGSTSERFSLDKDVKPIYFDFRNPLLAEVASKAVVRFEKLCITEMLPSVEGCWLHSEEGHYSCEFRTVVMASRESRTDEDHSDSGSLQQRTALEISALANPIRG